MLITREDETELLAALHEGMFEDPLWSTFLDRLRKRVGADYASLIFRRRDAPINQIVELFSGKTAPASLHRRYVEEIHRLDPVPYHELKPGRVYTLMELVDLKDPDHAAYINNFLAPSRANFIRILRIVEPSGYNGWLTLCRTDSEFSAASVALVAALANHMSIALRSFAAIESGRIRENIYADVIHKLNFGCLTLDASGGIVDLDSHAERLLRDSPSLSRDPHGKLLLATSQANGALRCALRDFAANRSERARAILLNDDPYLNMLLVPMRHKAVAGTVTPVMIAYVHGDEDQSADRCDQLVELFGLSRTEAKLALALSRGRTLNEAAGEIGITIETARSYSKRIFSKTGTRRQAELVRLILASVLALA